MPTDKRKWQPCGVGLVDWDHQKAISGCHASKHWTGDRTYHTAPARVKLAIKAIDAIEGDLSDGLVPLYRSDKEAFAKRVLAVVLPWRWEEVGKCCYACFKQHFTAQLVAQHRVFRR